MHANGTNGLRLSLVGAAALAFFGWMWLDPGRNRDLEFFLAAATFVALPVPELETSNTRSADAPRSKFEGVVVNAIATSVCARGVMHNAASMNCRIQSVLQVENWSVPLTVGDIRKSPVTEFE